MTQANPLHLAAPKTKLEEYRFAGPTLLPEPIKRPASAGWKWIADAWSIYKQEPMMWTGMLLLWWFGVMIISIILACIPFGSLLINLAQGGLMGGWLLAAYKVDTRERLDIKYLWAGFQRNAGELMIVGLLYLAGIFCAMVPAGGLLIIGIAMSGDLKGLSGAELLMAPGMLLLILAALVYLALIIPVIMGFWFSPALVMLNNMSAWDAFKLSFRACMRNIWPFFVYTLCMLPLALLAMLPCFLGFFVLMPIAIVIYYTSYRDILTEI